MKKTCRTCGGRWSRPFTKLGSCPKCMRWSALGVLAGWSVFALTVLFWPLSPFRNSALVVAASFTLWLMTHLGVFLFRWTRPIAAVNTVSHDGRESSHGRTRRRFVFAGVATFAGIVLAPVVGLGPFRTFGWAQALCSECDRAASDCTSGCSSSETLEERQSCELSCQFTFEACRQRCEGDCITSSFRDLQECYDKCFDPIRLPRPTFDRGSQTLTPSTPDPSDSSNCREMCNETLDVRRLRCG